MPSFWFEAESAETPATMPTMKTIKNINIAERNATNVRKPPFVVTTLIVVGVDSVIFLYLLDSST